jgi:oligoribonuclease
VSADRLVWVDCEMTGLDPRRDVLLELAVLVTDSELTVLGEGVDLVIRPPDGVLDGMDDVVRTMHERSGLLDVLAGGVTPAEAEAAALAYVRQHVPEPRKAPLAGNSVHMDRLFLAQEMPTLTEWLHYRNVDVSSLKELVRRWYPRVYFASPRKTGNHRALGDIQDSIRELRYYRETVLVEQPGPTSAQAKVAAARAAQPDTPADPVH